jgi:hypothetical protein
MILYAIIPRAGLPKRFSTATQLLKRQSIATHTALVDNKKIFQKRKCFLFIIEYNFTAYIMCLIFLPFSNFVLFFQFPISYEV